jgi:mannose-6-phosphate isomerase-like protein (cupin superfamily)
MTTDKHPPTRSSPPGRVKADALRLRTDTKDGGFTVGVAIDYESHGSDILLGAAWLEPGTERTSWTADDETFEAYYLVSGSLTVEWSGSDAGIAILQPGDSFYFPPSHKYTLENAGADPVHLVWTVIPPPSAGGE